METEAEYSIGFKFNLGKFVTPCAQSSQAPLLESADDWEENLTKNHFKNMDKYNKLAIDLREGKHHGVEWTVVHLCVEVGA